MLTIFKRELKALFTCYRGYAFVCVFAVGFCLLRMVYHYLLMDKLTFIIYDAGYGTILSLASYEYMLAYLPAAFALASPFLTYAIFDNEKNGGALGFLRSLPFTSADIIFGKYLAVFSVFCIAFGSLTVASLILGFYSGSEFLSVLLSVLFYVLVCNTILAVNVFIAAVCKNRFWALGISYGVNAVLIALSATKYTVPYALGRFFEGFSLIGSYTSSLLGVLDISSLVLQLSVSSLFIYLTYAFMKNEFSK